jgi:hypothetical protein
MPLKTHGMDAGRVTQFSRVDSSGEISLEIHDPGTKSAA